MSGRSCSAARSRFVAASGPAGAASPTSHKLLQAITQSGSYLTGLAGALAPALVGFVVAWYVTGYFNNRNERGNLIGMRVLSMVMAVVFFLFVDTYVAAYGVAHDAGFNLLLPNLTFTLAVLLYAVFRYHPIPDAEVTATAKATE
jgi:hypothetical protein